MGNRVREAINMFGVSKDGAIYSTVAMTRVNTVRCSGVVGKYKKKKKQLERQFLRNARYIAIAVSGRETRH